VRGDTLVHVLDEAGVCVAAGSACASGSAEPSHVLTAMGFEPRRARSGLRVTLGPATTDADVDRFLEVLGAALGRLRLAAASAR
jgi:cysteine desulfurase